jgi:hypothetical protein
MGFKTSISEYLLDAQVMIENSLSDDEIRRALLNYGYDEARLQAGKTLYEETSDWINRQKKEYGEKFEATSEVQKAWEEAHTAYIKTLKVSRIALQGNVKAQNALMINNKRKQSLSGWLEQAQAFYKNLISDIDLMKEMQKFGYTADKLNAEFELVKTLVQKNLKQKNGSGNAQEATALRDKKIDELEKWLSDFKSIVKIALYEHPQKLEKLGIIQRRPGESGKKNSKQEKTSQGKTS